MKYLTALLSGLLFGIGLIISGMTDPAKVIGFLDITGIWNPSLAIVMGSAIPMTYLTFRYLEKRKKTLLNSPLHFPGITHLNRELIIGSIIFGFGWALAGFCPGPAIVSLGAGRFELISFVIAMMIGMQLTGSISKILIKKP
ncbi:MAG: DUF6691 family protein [Betaproteobacteria bacterium]